MKYDKRRIIDALGRIDGKKIAVFGDFCLDKYLYIDEKLDEPSLETGLTAFRVGEARLYPGAGGNVANNLLSLGAQVVCVGLVGDDGDGYDLMRVLSAAGADTSLMVRDRGVPTCTYMKPMRRGADGRFAELNRLDVKIAAPLPGRLEEALLRNLESVLGQVDGVAVTDQFLERNCAALTDRIRERISGLGEEYPRLPFYVDSRGFAGEYRNVIIKCNERELTGAADSAQLSVRELSAAGRARQQKNGRPVVVTAGERGAFVIEAGAVTHIPAFPVCGPVDIVGAGDATSAGTLLGLALGLDLRHAAAMGGCVSSITIQQLGVTGTADVSQLRERLESSGIEFSEIG